MVLGEALLIGTNITLLSTLGVSKLADVTGTGVNDMVPDELLALVDCPISGLVDCPISGLVDCPISGLVDCPISGLVDCPISGLVDCPICRLIEEAPADWPTGVLNSRLADVD